MGAGPAVTSACEIAAAHAPFDPSGSFEVAVCWPLRKARALDVLVASKWNVPGGGKNDTIGAPAGTWEGPGTKFEARNCSWNFRHSDQLRSISLARRRFA